MQVSGLRVHPVKSTAIRSVQAAYVSRAGVRGDREWMVVDGDGKLVSARELPRLFSVTADNRATGVDVDLRLGAPGMPNLDVQHPRTDLVTVRMFSEPPMQARPVGEEADEWLQQAVDHDDLHLVWCDDPTRRALDPDYSRDGDHTAFADGFPLNLVTDASVAQLDTWVRETAVERAEAPTVITAARFRANIEISGAPAPFAEDQWSRIRIGEVDFRVPLPSARCVMTTIDEDLRKGKEPIRTLARHRRWEGATWFAANLIPDTEGTVRVGDELTVLEQVAPG
ncbi:MOSC N-terminal beta barrel domain-containing protein [Allobranchiibius sp. GilTou38]|uniref:MOSC domain-containing protein n=1 Tax=Allobranchiibius sp. GilTou38 TaxID=2815210 RepID=UPI001AA0DF2A|nr:MOSC N-terminal beta barrel domain-containing protein [Allobranchiibius sp. GilTou38]MBO1767895.1 MOSC domain-containing protein [Allobranchiibius sp. GilTou38]